MFLDDNRFRGFDLSGGPRLGIEEGEIRETCPPGTVKSYLPDFPWHECIPEEEALEPTPPTDLVVPEERPEVIEVEPLPRRPPGKARWLKMEEDTGEIVDPNTNQPIESLYAATPVETVVTVGVGAGILAAILVAAGVFK